MPDEWKLEEKATVGSKQHRVPAALVGRFGRRQAGQPWRQATVLVADLHTGRSFCRSAETVALERGAFDYADGTRSIDPLWDDVERGLGAAIDWVRENLRPTRTALPVDDTLQHVNAVARYIADITLRSPDFDRTCAHTGMSTDEIQDLRMRLATERRARYSAGELDLELLIRRNRSAGTLLINDLGYVRLVAAENGLLVPLAPDLGGFLRLGPPALHAPSLGLGWLDPHVAEARRAMLEARPASGGHGPRWVYSHPDDALPGLV